MTAGTRVLVVDDDADVRVTVAEALEDEGYRVVGAPGAKEALRLLRSGDARPDVILLDMMMPEMDGWTFRAEQLLDPAIASIPVVLCTAYGVQRGVTDDLRAAAVLHKPFRLDELLSTLAMFDPR